MQHWLELELWLHEDEDFDASTPAVCCKFDNNGFGWSWLGFEAENGLVPETFGEASSRKFV